MYANLSRQLREHRSFNENRRGFGWPWVIRYAVEYVVQYFRDNPRIARNYKHWCLGNEGAWNFLVLLKKCFFWVSYLMSKFVPLVV